MTFMNPFPVETVALCIRKLNDVLESVSRRREIQAQKRRVRSWWKRCTWSNASGMPYNSPQIRLKTAGLYGYEV